MKHWNDYDVMNVDRAEGEIIMDKDNPHPAYKGTIHTNKKTLIEYECEIVPGTDRTGTTIDPNTFFPVVDTVVDILYRTWDDDTKNWKEVTLTMLLRLWGYTSIPTDSITNKISNFDRAMKGV